MYKQCSNAEDYLKMIVFSLTLHFLVGAIVVVCSYAPLQYLSHSTNIGCSSALNGMSSHQYFSFFLFFFFQASLLLRLAMECSTLTRYCLVFMFQVYRIMPENLYSGKKYCCFYITNVPVHSQHSCQFVNPSSLALYQWAAAVGQCMHEPHVIIDVSHFHGITC